MKPLLFLLALLLSAPVCASAKGKKSAAPDVRGAAMRTISEAEARAHVGFLASDALRGRKAGTGDSRVAAEYIIALLRQWGIAPLQQSGYKQPFSAYSMEWQKKKPWYVEPDSVQKLQALPAHRRLDMANVLAVVPGERTDEYVIVGAHFDHVGTDPDLDGDKIYNGADDNASGVSAALQIAHAFARGTKKPLRTIIFAFWDGEEIGLLGSRHFCQTFEHMDRVRGYLNFDMVGRNSREDHPQFCAYIYTEAHPAFGQWLKDDMARYQLRLEPEYRPWDNPVGGSDNGSFAKKGVPIIWYHTEGHPDYHQPSDHADRINYDKLTEISRAAFLNTWNLANEETY